MPNLSGFGAVGNVSWVGNTSVGAGLPPAPMWAQSLGRLPEAERVAMPGRQYIVATPMEAARGTLLRKLVIDDLNEEKKAVSLAIKHEPRLSVQRKMYQELDALSVQRRVAEKQDPLDWIRMERHLRDDTVGELPLHLRSLLERSGEERNRISGPAENATPAGAGGASAGSAAEASNAVRKRRDTHNTSGRNRRSHTEQEKRQWDSVMTRFPKLQSEMIKAVKLHEEQPKFQISGDQETPSRTALKVGGPILEKMIRSNPGLGPRDQETLKQTVLRRLERLFGEPPVPLIEGPRGVSKDGALGRPETPARELFKVMFAEHRKETNEESTPDNAAQFLRNQARNWRGRQAVYDEAYLTRSEKASMDLHYFEKLFPKMGYAQAAAEAKLTEILADSPLPWTKKKTEVYQQEFSRIWTKTVGTGASSSRRIKIEPHLGEGLKAIYLSWVKYRAKEKQDETNAQRAERS